MRAWAVATGRGAGEITRTSTKETKGSKVHEGNDEDHYTGSRVFTAEVAEVAAVAAARRGQSELIISWQAQLLARFHGLLPGLTADFLGVVSGLLPHASGTPDERRGWRGADCETPITRSFLTSLTQRAARANNEWAAWEQEGRHEAEPQAEALEEVPSPS